MTAITLTSLRDRLSYQSLMLGVTCLAISLLLLFGDRVTRDRIEAHHTADRLAMLQQVLPAPLYDNQPLDEAITLGNTTGFAQAPTLYVARQQGTVSGAAVLAAVAGWGGQIDLIVGVDQHGTVTGVRVISHGETPGLADKIELERSPWITGFNGRSLDNTPTRAWAVRKDGGDFDQFTGATITPRSVVNGVHRSLLAHRQWQQSGPTQPREETTP